MKNSNTGLSTTTWNFYYSKTRNKLETQIKSNKVIRTNYKTQRSNRKPKEKPIIMTLFLVKCIYSCVAALPAAEHLDNSMTLISFSGKVTQFESHATFQRLSHSTWPARQGQMKECWRWKIMINRGRWKWVRTASQCQWYNEKQLQRLRQHDEIRLNSASAESVAAAAAACLCGLVPLRAPLIKIFGHVLSKEVNYSVRADSDKLYSFFFFFNVRISEPSEFLFEVYWDEQHLD